MSESYFTYFFITFLHTHLLEKSSPLHIYSMHDLTLSTDDLSGLLSHIYTTHGICRASKNSSSENTSHVQPSTEQPLEENDCFNQVGAFCGKHILVNLLAHSHRLDKCCQ